MEVGSFLTYFYIYLHFLLKNLSTAERLYFIGVSVVLNIVFEGLFCVYLKKIFGCLKQIFYFCVVIIKTIFFNHFKTLNMKTDFNAKKWYLNHNGEKVETTLADYLNDFWSDETTSPHGVRPRLHIREEMDEETGETIYELWTYGVNGNNPRKLETFETKDEAEKWILEYRYEKYLTTSNNAPCLFDSEQEIDEHIAEYLKTE